jgi:drug/metabolite transporter (DMT)-like permease
MVFSMLGYGCNDALIKLASSELPLVESIFIRGLFVVIAVLMLVRHQGVTIRLPPRGDRTLIGLRLIGEVVSTICFLTALMHMPIANVTAVLQATPIALTLAAAFVLGERIGWRRYLAIAIGFIGVIVLIQPGGDSFNRYSLWALAAVFFLVLRDLSTRRLSAQLPSLLVTLYTAVAITVVAGFIGLFSDWQLPSPRALALLGIAAMFLLAGYQFGIMAMRIGDIGFVSPFRYSIMLWAIGLGVVVFREVPDAMTLLGTLIVAATGSYTYYREYRQRQHS